MMSQSMNSPVVEVVVTRRKAGSSRADFLNTMTLAEQKLKTMPGFQRRQLLEGDDDNVIDLVWWESLDAAQAALGILNQDAELMTAFGDVLDPDNMTMMHLAPVALSQK